jgi:RNA polymerase sigma-70 factor, ECF subfamily
MLEDRLLLWKLRRGDTEALRHIYEKYKTDLLGLAIALSGDRATGEDVVHDVFVTFAGRAAELRLRTSLRSYLLTSVANRVRNLRKARTRQTVPPCDAPAASHEPSQPDHAAVQSEQATLIEQAMAQLPYDQQEVIALHLQMGLRFREIAVSQSVSVNTVQSRYRYGLEKLRSLLDGKVTP